MNRAVAITNAILEGVMDDELQAIQEAVQSRRRFLRDQQGIQNMAKLKPGAKVMTHGLSPKYLNGQLGVVIQEPARRRGDIMVEFPFSIGRYGKKIGVPASCLQEVGGEG